MSAVLSRLLQHQFQRYANNTAIVIDGRSLSYSELQKKALPLIKKLQDEKPTHVGILMGRTLHHYVSILACALFGVAYMPLDPRLSGKALAERLDLTKTPLVITEAMMEALPWVDDNVLPEPLENNDAYILFTSGSTGKSKAIAVGQSQLMHYVMMAQQRWKPEEQDRFSQIVALTFDLSVHDIFLCWSVGACLCVFTGTTYPELGDYFEQQAITFCLMVPSTARALARYKQLSQKRFQSLKMLLFCGEPLPYRVVYPMQRVAPFAQIENIYGPTEATIACMGYKIPRRLLFFEREVVQDIVSIGQAFDGLWAQVDETGELWLGGPQIVEGYLHDPERTHDLFYTEKGIRWYKTGDFVMMNLDGNLHFKGRRDEQWQVRGQRVERLALEMQFKALANCEELVVIPSPITSEGLVLGIAVIMALHHQDDMHAFRKQCQQHCVSPLIPTAYIQIDELPCNSNGKIDYNALLQRYQKKEVH